MKDERPKHPETGEPLETHRPSDAEKAARNRRNLFIALGLVAFAVLVFAVTVMRLSANISAGG
ncbi:hypothetical protein E5163_15815 [Marinicauda algicola]|uniref:Uncharacterized protein n=1 Tax=Marinicauda algicola TaxID=2029849 RepID=A0A4S2GVR3_9PROT|nr:hypothetical protein [Marinicauda algicola]TGY87187.1 hypothetical protein E5163_15815 [Marinicauda algicola]